eukprot:scaffold2723_cov108-Isochrysis_galbana.AAC.6
MPASRLPSRHMRTSAASRARSSSIALASLRASTSSSRASRAFDDEDLISSNFAFRCLSSASRRASSSLDDSRAVAASCLTRRKSASRRAIRMVSASSSQANDVSAHRDHARHSAVERQAERIASRPDTPRAERSLFNSRSCSSHSARSSSAVAIVRLI